MTDASNRLHPQPGRAGLVVAATLLVAALIVVLQRITQDLPLGVLALLATTALLVLASLEPPRRHDS